jgi:hypothetical protein
MTVSISHSVFDAVGPNATPIGSTQPATVSALLRELGMAHASVEKQKAALGTWLMIHEAQRPLRISLRENGFGLLLKQADRDRARPRSLA